MDFAGKVVVVTGAGGGIGRQLVVQLLDRGASIAAVDVSETALQGTLSAAGPRGQKVSLHVVDITDRERVCTLPGEVEERHGTVDILINNAGIIQPFVPFAELEHEVIDRVMNINVYGPIFMTRAFLPYLAKRPEAYIANVSSMGGFLPVPGQTLYGASKAAVKLLTEGLRAELAHSRIGVSVIMPGGVNTNITKNSGVVSTAEQNADAKAPTSMTSPEAAARTIVEGIRRERARILVGRDARFMDILSRVAPVRAGKFISKMMASLLEERFTNLDLVQFRGCSDSDKR